MPIDGVDSGIEETDYGEGPVVEEPDNEEDACVDDLERD